MRARRSRGNGSALRRRYGRAAATACGKPQSSCSGDELTRLKRSVARTVTGERVKRFYIGRSVNVENRASGLDSDEVVCLLETSSQHRAAVVEDALLKHFRHHPKSKNVRADSGGNATEGLQHVYLAVWRA
jgi:hypothetical protein